jgi:radical SAM protein (TIGR01212 family)
MMETAKIIAALGLDGIKIHLLHILKGTAMAKQYARGELRVLELEEYVDLVCEFLEYLPPQMLIHRLTGEGPRDIHIAPDWALDKAKVLARIDQELERRHTYQGAKYGFSVDLQQAPPLEGSLP